MVGAKKELVGCAAGRLPKGEKLLGQGPATITLLRHVMAGENKLLRARDNIVSCLDNLDPAAQPVICETAVIIRSGVRNLEACLLRIATVLACLIATLFALVFGSMFPNSVLLSATVF